MTSPAKFEPPVDLAMATWDLAREVIAAARDGGDIDTEFGIAVLQSANAWGETLRLHDRAIAGRQQPQAPQGPVNPLFCHRPEYAALKKRERVLLDYFAEADDGEVTATYRELSEATGYGRETLRSALDQLDGLGFIDWKTTREGHLVKVLFSE
jgi:hypothetical protein